jgi:N-acetyl-anhydromuramyl-L-alanine amidase AmpD
MNRTIVMLAGVLMAGCGGGSSGATDSPTATEIGDNEAALRTSEALDPAFEVASREFGVPAAALKATAWALTRYENVETVAHLDGEEGEVAAEKQFGPMLVKASLAKTQATVLGVAEAQVQQDPATNIRAAAADLAARAKVAGIDTASLLAWGPVVADYAGLSTFEAVQQFISDEYLAALTAGVGRPTEALAGTAQGFEVEKQVGEYATSKQSLARGPDYGTAIWRASPNFSNRNGGRSPELVVIHTCEGGYAGCVSTLINERVSAHYVVSTTGEITQLVRESKRAWHVAANYSCSLNSNVGCAWNGVSGNDLTVGIEHAGSASQNSFPAAQIGESAKLVCSITKRWDIPRDRFHIVAHGKLQPATRTDPGRNWPWQSYLEKINAACGANPTPNPNPTPAPAGSVIIDSNNANNDSAKARVEVSANWNSSANVGGYFGTGYFYAKTAEIADGAAFWFYLPTPGNKTVEAWWTAAGDRSSDTTFVAFNAAGARVGEGSVNQTINGGKWNGVGSFAFTTGWNRVVLSRWQTAGKVVVADAVRIR